MSLFCPLNWGEVIKFTFFREFFVTAVIVEILDFGCTAKPLVKVDFFELFGLWLSGLAPLYLVFKPYFCKPYSSKLISETVNEGEPPNFLPYSSLSIVRMYWLCSIFLSKFFLNIAITSALLYPVFLACAMSCNIRPKPGTSPGGLAGSGSSERVSLSDLMLFSTRSHGCWDIEVFW